MILDDLLIALIIAGMGISGAYLRAELLLHRRLTAVQRIRQLQQRQLHNTRKIPTCEPPSNPWPQAIVYFQRPKPQKRKVDLERPRSAKCVSG